MLDEMLLKKVIDNITRYADDRKIVMYGKNDELKNKLSESGYEVNRIYTSNSALYKENAQVYRNCTELKGQSDKYYVVIPFLLDDDGKSQRERMDKYGYEKYIDYIFFPNDEYIDQVIYNVKKHFNGREVAAYGYLAQINSLFKKEGFNIHTFFTGNGELLKDKSVGFSDFHNMKEKSDKYYIIIPFLLDSTGEKQRKIMQSFGYKEYYDYVFCQQCDSGILKVSDDRFKNKELAKRLYIPDRYKDKWYSAFDKKYLSDRKLSVNELDNGVILPLVGVNDITYGGVCDENYNFVAGHLNYSPTGQSVGRIANSYVPDQEPEYVDETVVFGGAMFNHPGHLMYEMFCQRLWWCVQNPDSNLRIAICFTWGDQEGTFIKQFLELLEIDLNRVIFVKKPLKFKKIIIPDQSMYPSRGDTPYDITKEYISVYEQMSKNIVPGKDKKIYLSKLKTIKQDIANEKYFVDFYRNKGFRIVDPEDYTIKEKAQMMAGADEVVSNIGTNTLFAVFCKPSVRITLTTRVNDQIMDCQAMAHEARGIKDFYVVDVSLNFLHKHRIWGTNILGVTNEWKQFVKDIYGEEISETTESSLKDGLYDYLKISAEYYSSPGGFRKFASYDHLEIINNMNEVFLGDPLSDVKYKLLSGIQQEILNKKENRYVQVDEFLINLLFYNKYRALINVLSEKNVSLLCNDTLVTDILKQIFKAFDIDVKFYSKKSRLKELNDDEWSKCSASDIIISYDDYGYDPGKRDGIKAYDICDILSDAYNNEFGENNELYLIKEIRLTRDELSKQISLLKEQISINTEMKDQADKLIAEKEAANERLLNSIAAQNKLNRELASIKQEREDLKGDISQLKAEAKRLSKEAEDIKKEYKKVADKLKEEHNEGELKDNRIAALSERISEMRSTRSWRYTRIFRKNKKDEEI